MNKKNFNIKFGTVFSVAFSFLAAVVVWLIAKYGITYAESAPSLFNLNIFTPRG